VFNASPLLSKKKDTYSWPIGILDFYRYETATSALQYFYDFYSAAALHAMQSAVIPTAIPSVRLSHAGTLSRRMNIGLRGLHCEVAKTL